MASKLSKSPSSPKPGHKIGEKGAPILGVGSVPGYNKSSGTPGWVKGAASSAAGKVDKGTGMEHRSHAHQSGAPPRKGDK